MNSNNRVWVFKKILKCIVQEAYENQLNIGIAPEPITL